MNTYHTEEEDVDRFDTYDTEEIVIDENDCNGEDESNMIVQPAIHLKKTPFEVSRSSKVATGNGNMLLSNDSKMSVSEEWEYHRYLRLPWLVNMYSDVALGVFWRIALVAATIYALYPPFLTLNDAKKQCERERQLALMDQDHCTSMYNSHCMINVNTPIMMVDPSRLEQCKEWLRCSNVPPIKIRSQCYMNILSRNLSAFYEPLGWTTIFKWYLSVLLMIIAGVLWLKWCKVTGPIRRGE